MGKIPEIGKDQKSLRNNYIWNWPVHSYHHLCGTPDISLSLRVSFPVSLRIGLYPVIGLCKLNG